MEGNPALDAIRRLSSDSIFSPSNTASPLVAPRLLEEKSEAKEAHHESTSAHVDDSTPATIEACDESDTSKEQKIDSNTEEIIAKVKSLIKCESITVHDSGEIEVLPSGWTKRVSKSNQGKIYYVSPVGQTQWLRPLVKTELEYNWNHEIEVTFGPGRLGLNLKQLLGEPGVVFTDIQVYIAEIYKLPNGLASPAEIYNWSVKPEKRLYVGMRMTAIDGISLIGHSYAEVLERLNKTPRPVRIKFADITKGIVGRVDQKPSEEQAAREREVKSIMSKQNNLQMEYLKILISRELHSEIFGISKIRLGRFEKELVKKSEVMQVNVCSVNDQHSKLEKDVQILIDEEKHYQEMIKKLQLQEAGELQSPEVQKAHELSDRNQALDKEIRETSSENEELRKMRIELQQSLDDIEKSLSELAMVEEVEDTVQQISVLEALGLTEDDWESMDKGVLRSKLSKKLTEWEEEIQKESDRAQQAESEISQFRKQLASANAASKREDDMISGVKSPQYIFLENKIETLRRNLRDTVASMAKVNSNSTGDDVAATLQQLSQRRLQLKNDLKSALDEMQRMEKELDIKSDSKETNMPSESHSMTISDDDNAHLDKETDSGDALSEGPSPNNTAERQSQNAAADHLQNRLANLRTQLHDTVSQMAKANGDGTIVKDLSARRLVLKEEIKAVQEEYEKATSKKSPLNTDTTTSTAPKPVLVVKPENDKFLSIASLIKRGSEKLSRDSGLSRDSNTSADSGMTPSTSAPISLPSVALAAPAVTERNSHSRKVFPVISGILMKHPSQHNEKGLLDKMKAKRGARERWCDVDAISGSMRYFKRRGDREPRGHIALNDKSLEVVYTRDGRSTEFLICTHTHQSRFLAKTHEEMLKWANAVEDAHNILLKREEDDVGSEASVKRQDSVSSNERDIVAEIHERRATLGF